MESEKWGKIESFRNEILFFLWGKSDLSDQSDLSDVSDWSDHQLVDSLTCWLVGLLACYSYWFLRRYLLATCWRIANFSMRWGG